jgi:hypothetical protein
MNSLHGTLGSVGIWILGALFGLAGCAARTAPPAAAPVAPTPAAAVAGLKPVASIQELMQSEVDPSADHIWDAVETVVTRSGTEERHPRTEEQWADLRRSAITLVEATNLLQMDGRQVSTRPFAAEADGALDSIQIGQRLAANRSGFNAFAQSLRTAVLRQLAAIDARDPAALVRAGGDVDEVCEACHLTFWYPNQVIPPLPEHIPPLPPLKTHPR